MSRLITKKKPQKEIIIALVLSILLIHIPLLWLLTTMDLGSELEMPAPLNNQKEEVVMMDLNMPPPSLDTIVDIDKPKVQKKPKKATAQSLYDSSVTEEVVSAANTPQATPPSKPQATTTPSQNKTETTQPKNLNDELAMLFNEAKQKEDEKYTDRFENTQTTTAPTLKTNFNSPNPFAGDFLPNYKVGNRTYLNTLANPNVGYYVELKRKFRMAFNPYAALRYHLNEISRGQISVVWGVSIDQNGNLAGLTLIRPSGIGDYDMEARRTISVSAPFNKPPVDQLTEDKMMHMAWTFVVYL